MADNVTVALVAGNFSIQTTTTYPAIFFCGPEIWVILSAVSRGPVIFVTWGTNSTPGYRRKRLATPAGEKAWPSASVGCNRRVAAAAAFRPHAFIYGPLISSGGEIRQVNAEADNLCTYSIDTDHD